MPANHRSSQLSFARGTPDLSLLGIEHAPELPAVRWCQQKLDTLVPIAVRTAERPLVVERAFWVVTVVR